MVQMQPPLGWNAIVILAHPVVRLTMKDLLYYASGLIYLFVKWELSGTSVRFSDWKGQLLVSGILKSLNLPRKFRQVVLIRSFKQLQPTSLKLCSVNPEDWTVVLTSLELEYQSYSCQGGKLCFLSFLCLGWFFTLLQDSHDFGWHPWKCQGIERLQERK